MVHLPSKVQRTSSSIRPNQVPGLIAWFQPNKGITLDVGVSQWDDQSGNGHHLKQVTGSKQPTIDAEGVLTFDGVDDCVVTDAFTLVQPLTFYLNLKIITYVDRTRILQGHNNAGLFMDDDPGQAIVNNASDKGVHNSNWSEGQEFTIGFTLNSTNSFVYVDGQTDGAGSIGTINPEGFGVGCFNPQGSGTFASNIAVREVIAYQGAHNPKQIFELTRYLQTKRV